jgi:septal ring factor EnvC (AmiA/AmiB activator)
MMATFKKRPGRTDAYRAATRPRTGWLQTLVLLGALLLPLASTRADDRPSAKDLVAMREQIEELELEAKSEQRRFDESERRIRQLASQLREMEAQNQRLSEMTQKLTSSDREFKSETDRQLEELQQHSQSISSSQFAAGFARYLGTHQFTIAGDAAVSFIYNHATSQNTFNVQFQPILLYRLND